MERGCFTGVGVGTQPQPRPNIREDQPGLQLNSPCLLLPPASASWLEATGQRAWAMLEVSLLQHREQGAGKAFEQGHKWSEPPTFWGQCSNRKGLGGGRYGWHVLGAARGSPGQELREQMEAL